MNTLINNIIPAIETEYLKIYPYLGRNYADLCEFFRKQGASLVQVILDKPDEEEVIKLKNEFNDLSLIVGGNISSKSDAKDLLTAGANFVIIGKFRRW